MTCPRCDSNEAYEVFKAPDGIWEIYRCPRCNFNWRSSEADEVKEGALYDPRFKMTSRRLRDMVPKPPIPPLKSNG
jgi:vanillate/4-hydroxybenzoate decarboxylase subunit D